MKYAIYEAKPVKGKFKRVSDWFSTKEEAVTMMNKHYPRATKVMWWKNKEEHGIVSYNIAY